MHLKVLSWNIWIDGDYAEMQRILTLENADIIGLQEVKDNDPERPILTHLASLGYESIFMPVEKTWGGKIYRDGPAILSRYPIVSSQSHDLSRENNRGAVQANIQIGDTQMHVLSTHLLHTHQKDSPVQNEQADSLLKISPRERTIIVGDFNATPGSYPIRKISEVFANTDSSNAATWSTHLNGCNVCKIDTPQIRLDYIFASKDLAYSNAKVGYSTASDHLPISVEIRI